MVVWWQGGGTAVWRDGGMAGWRDGGMAVWWVTLRFTHPT